MSATRTFRLGSSTITWGGTPDLDEVLGTIADAGWEGAEFIGISLGWLGTPRRLRPCSTGTACRRSACSAVSAWEGMSTRCSSVRGASSSTERSGGSASQRHYGHLFFDE